MKYVIYIPGTFQSVQRIHIIPQMYKSLDMVQK